MNFIRYILRRSLGSRPASKNSSAGQRASLPLHRSRQTEELISAQRIESSGTQQMKYSAAIQRRRPAAFA